MDKLSKYLKTTPHDKAHFSATNQSHYCWQRYNEYVLCVKKNDGDEDACKSARQLALSICIDADIEAWDEQRVNGNFLGVQEKPPAAAGHH